MVLRSALGARFAVVFYLERVVSYFLLLGPGD